MIKLEGGPLDGYEADAADAPLVCIPHNVIEIRVPDPDDAELTVTHCYFVGPTGATAAFLGTSIFGEMDAGVQTSIQHPVLRPPQQE